MRCHAALHSYLPLPSESPEWKRLPLVDLNDVVQFFGRDDSSPCAIIEDPFARDMDFPDDKPRWTLLVLRDGTILFVWDHTIGDGQSALAFHHALLSAFNRTGSEPPTEHSGVIVDLPLDLPLPPTLEDAAGRQMSIPFRMLVRVLAEEYLPVSAWQTRHRMDGQSRPCHDHPRDPSPRPALLPVRNQPAPSNFEEAQRLADGRVTHPRPPRPLAPYPRTPKQRGSEVRHNRDLSPDLHAPSHTDSPNRDVAARLALRRTPSHVPSIPRSRTRSRRVSVGRRRRVHHHAPAGGGTGGAHRGDNEVPLRAVRGVLQGAPREEVHLRSGDIEPRVIPRAGSVHHVAGKRECTRVSGGDPVEDRGDDVRRRTRCSERR